MRKEREREREKLPQENEEMGKANKQAQKQSIWRKRGDKKQHRKNSAIPHIVGKQKEIQ